MALLLNILSFFSIKTRTIFQAPTQAEACGYQPLLFIIKTRNIFQVNGLSSRRDFRPLYPINPLTAFLFSLEFSCFLG